MVFGLSIIIFSILLIKSFCVLAKNTNFMDKPNDRSLHTVPTIRGGGLVFISLSLCSLPFICYLTQSSLGEHFILMLSIVLIAAISLYDDLYTLPAKPRFVVQAVVAGLICLFMSPRELDFIFFSLTNLYFIGVFIFLATIWAINHFNFMDGLDGFCASQAVFLFASYALLFNFHHAWMYQDFCLVLVCSLIGFLIFNFPPSKLFMGDIGSATLGLITFSIALIAQHKYQIPLIYWFVLNSLFLFDSTITLVRRVINKEKWSSAHRKHAYQRLKQYGLDTRVILLGQLILNLSFLMGVLFLQNNIINLSSLLIFIFSTLIIIYCLTERFYPMFQLMKH
jgi:UDP-N-acetylmuramyl pentapeptide phosphotransferase/UDP-N-acetylglucosamine-1-phosphate transferase